MVITAGATDSGQTPESPIYIKKNMWKLDSHIYGPVAVHTHPPKPLDHIPGCKPLDVDKFVDAVKEGIEASKESRHVQDLISKECDEVKELLIQKNRKYGNSALNPSRIFARSDAAEQIKVRIDDKLNRIKNAQNDEDEDVVQDLIGYLILLKVWKKLNPST